MYVGTCEYINSRDERACQIILIKNHIIFIKYNVAFPLKKICMCICKNINIIDLYIYVHMHALHLLI